MTPGSKPAPSFISPVHSDASGPIFRLPARFGKYTLTKRLGVGGMAEVFLAQQDGPAGFAKQCVIKRILPHLAMDERFVRMFQAEAKLAAMLTHTNVAQIYELGDVDGIYFIAMEYVDGAALHTLARSAWRRKRALPLEVICCAMADAALGLQAAHDQTGPDGLPLHLVHRDISPDNLMINREGVTKVVDFGIAKSVTHERTATGELKGKIPFMSPEQVRGEAVDSRADLYALGVTFYWLLTGRRPIVAPTDLALLQAILSTKPLPPREHNPTIPVEIDALVLKLLEKAPGDRIQSAAEVHDLIAAALTARRSVVAPFVREILDADPAPSNAEGDPLLAPGFLPSTPQVDELKASWKKLVSQNDPRHDVTLEQPTISTIDLPDAVVADPDPLLLPPRSRLPQVAAALGAVAFAFVGGLYLSRAPEPTAPEPPAPTTSALLVPTVVPAPEPPVVAPTPPAPTLPEPARAIEAEPDADAPEPKPRPEERAATREIEVAGPSDIAWQSERGKLLRTGPGTLKLPAGMKRIVAVDKKRGARTRVAVAPRIDYAALPHGKLQTRANPYADVFLGSEPLGTTPFAPTDVVAGKYVVRFTHDGREEKRTVDVRPGETVRVIVDFTK